MKRILAASIVLVALLIGVQTALGQEEPVAMSGGDEIEIAPLLPAEEIGGEPVEMTEEDLLQREEDLMGELLAGEETEFVEEAFVDDFAPEEPGEAELVPFEELSDEDLAAGEVEELMGVMEEADLDSELIELDVERELSEGIDVVEAEEEKDLITISLDDVPLRDVVRMFTRISGANIVAGTNLQGNVTVSLQDVEWEPALRVILDSVDMTMVEKTPGIYSIMSKSALAAEPVTVDTVFLSFTTVSNVLPIVKRMLVTTNASVSSFASANAIVIQETAAQLKNIKATLEKLDVPRPQVFIEAKFVELNDQAIKDIGVNWQVLSGYNVVLRSPTFAWTRARNLEKGTDETTTRTLLETSLDRVSDIDSRTSFDTSADIDSETSDILDSFLLVNGVPSFIFQSQDEENQGESDLSGDSRDSAWQRTSDDSRAEARSYTREVTDAVTTTTDELLAAILTADDFQLTLSALKQNGGVDVVSNPRVIVASGGTARIHVGVREPNIEAKPQGDSGNVYVYGLGSPQFFEVGVKVAVTPIVNTEDRITVKITPELSRLLTPATVPQAGISFPRIQTRKIITEFNLESGRTVAIGGLTQTGDREQISKVPILGDIPIIGRYLFRHTHTEQEQDEVIIFVTVGLAGAEVLTEVAGVPSGGRLIHKHLAKESIQAQ